MNTVEERAIVHKKEQEANHGDHDVEKGRDNALDHEAAGMRTDGDDVNVREAQTYNTSGLYKKQADLPPLKGLSFLDRFLVLWILIAMGIGIAIGNTVDNAGPALQRGEFVGVSIPIGMSLLVFVTFGDC